MENIRTEKTSISKKAVVGSELFYILLILFISLVPTHNNINTNKRLIIKLQRIVDLHLADIGNDRNFDLILSRMLWCYFIQGFLYNNRQEYV